MTLLLILIIGFGTALISRKVFGKWINHVSIYFGVWAFMLFLFELKLFRYLPLTNETWFVIILGAMCFFTGSMTVYTARMLNEPKIPEQKRLLLIADKGNILRFVIILTGVIGLLAAVQNWYVLISKYGSIVKVLLAASEIYRSRVENKVEGAIPYLQAFSYISLLLASIYTAYKNKFTFILLIPLSGLILKSLASFARIGILIAFVEFVAGYILTRHFLANNYTKVKLQLKTVILIMVLVLSIVTAASTVKVFRGAYERYKGADPVLNDLRDNPFFSPSIYLYLSSHVGVLNQYLQDPAEGLLLGENTFAAFFNLLSKFDLTERIPYDVRGYFIPMWTNTGTYLRDLYSDFGFIGITIVPWLIGFLTTFYWFRFFDSGKSFYLVILVHLYMIIGITFFSLITRGADWWASLITLLFIVPYMEKRALCNKTIKVV